jgi:hypothetical protein
MRGYGTCCCFPWVVTIPDRAVPVLAVRLGVAISGEFRRGARRAVDESSLSGQMMIQNLRQCLDQVRATHSDWTTQDWRAANQVFEARRRSGLPLPVGLQL